MVAHTLARAGARVVVLEKGPNYFRGLGSRFGLRTALFSNDEIKIQRRVMLGPDPLVEPRTFRNYESDGARLAVGEVNATPTTVGGASVTADLAARRCQPADFRMATLLGPVPGADFQDWPVTLDAWCPTTRRPAHRGRPGPRHRPLRGAARATSDAARAPALRESPRRRRGTRPRLSAVPDPARDQLTPLARAPGVHRLRLLRRLRLPDQRQGHRRHDPARGDGDGAL
jgi:choline dehydrogenase-like flavoprotein